MESIGAGVGGGAVTVAESGGLGVRESKSRVACAVRTRRVGEARMGDRAYRIGEAVSLSDRLVSLKDDVTDRPADDSGT